MGPSQRVDADLAQKIVEVGWKLLESGVTDGTSGNVSARRADGQSILITPTGRDWRLLSERDLVRMDLETGKSSGRWQPSSEWRLHLEVYRKRADVAAVIHHHGAWASAVAVARRTIPVLMDEAADIGVIPTAPYAPSASQELAEVAGTQIGAGRNALLLANHGAVAIGRDLREALRRALEVERLAKIYVGAEALGGANALDEAEISRNRVFFEGYRQEQGDLPEAPPRMPAVTGPVRLYDLVTFGLRAGVTMTSLAWALIYQKLHR